MKILLVLLIGLVAVVGAAFAGLAVFGDSDEPEGGGSGVGTPVASIPPGASNGDLTAEELLEQSVERFRDVTSFHFVLTHENGSTPLPLNLNLVTAEGDIVVPDRMQANVDAEALGLNVTVNVIGIEDRTWVTNPFTRQWQELPNTNIRDFADPVALVSGLLPAIENPTMSEGGSIGGVDTHRVTGTIQSEALRDALGIAEPGRQVTVQAWIAKDDLLVRQVRLEGALSDAEASNVVRQVVISRYNQSIEIMPPE
jgi:hypothetical protein